MASFGAWDFAVLFCILAISASIGIYYRVTGGKQKTTKEYLLADHSMTVIPVALSLMASYMSAITLLGVSNEAYQFGMMFGAINLAYLLSTPISAYLFLPVFYRMHNVSVYEYLERRFGHSTRIAASLTYWVQMILYMGIVLYAPALALEAVTGVSRATAILVIGLVCTFYSTVGGLKAILITDCFQVLLMFVAAVTLEDYFKPLYFKLRQNHMEDRKTTVPAKIMVFLYGVICIILGFVASSMGGVLQASLTIFGVVGGPLLAIFTLGMCTTRGNQGGALTGLLFGLLFALSVGFGGPKPPPPSLDFSAAGCVGADNITIYVPAAPHHPPATYFLLFRISYMWFSVLGFLITLISGYCASVLLEKLNLANNLRIYLADNEIDCDLFIPPLARKLLRRNEQHLTKM